MKKIERFARLSLFWVATALIIFAGFSVVGAMNPQEQEAAQQDGLTDECTPVDPYVMIIYVDGFYVIEYNVSKDDACEIMDAAYNTHCFDSPYKIEL